jgi:hypothetical protein
MLRPQHARKIVELLSAARVGAWMSVDEALAMGTPSYGELLADL